MRESPPIIVGLDPGLSGGVAVIGPAGIETWPMPSIEVKTGHVLDVAALRIWLAFRCVPGGLGVHAFLEYAQAMPALPPGVAVAHGKPATYRGQGASSAFKYGRTWGEIHAVLVCLGLPYTVVHPARWTKLIHTGIEAADSKARSRIALQRLFPQINLAPPRGHKPHEGMMDALLIAEYGRRTLGVTQ